LYHYYYYTTAVFYASKIKKQIVMFNFAFNVNAKEFLMKYK